MRKKTMYLVEALDKDKIARVYGFSEYKEDARLNCIIALAERCLRKLEDGLKYIEGGSTDFYSYSFRVSTDPDWIKSVEQVEKKPKQLEFPFPELRANV
jgi:hypothetical protein